MCSPMPVVGSWTVHSQNGVPMFIIIMHRPKPVIMQTFSETSLRLQPLPKPLLRFITDAHKLVIAQDGQVNTGINQQERIQYKALACFHHLLWR